MYGQSLLPHVLRQSEDSHTPPVNNDWTNLRMFVLGLPCAKLHVVRTLMNNIQKENGQKAL